jgi:hypothetical protein
MRNNRPVFNSERTGVFSYFPIVQALSIEERDPLIRCGPTCSHINQRTQTGKTVKEISHVKIVDRFT